MKANISSFHKLDRQKSQFDKVYYENKGSLRDAAFSLGCSVNMLMRWMDERGYPRRNLPQAMVAFSRSRPRTEAVIRDRLLNKMTLEQIARKYGYASRGTVHHLLEKRGLAGLLDDLPPYDEYLKRRPITEQFQRNHHGPRPEEAPQRRSETGAEDPEEPGPPETGGSGTP